MNGSTTSGARKRARTGGDDAGEEEPAAAESLDAREGENEINALPDDILLRCMLVALEAEMGEPVQEMYRTSVPRDPIERLSQLASVCTHWRTVVTERNDRVWASITHAIFHVKPREPLPPLGKLHGWRGPLTLPPGQHVWYRGTRSAEVTLVGLDPSVPPDPSDRTQWYTLRLADQENDGQATKETSAIHVTPKSPWRVICLALVRGDRTLSLSHPARKRTTFCIGSKQESRR